MTAVTAASVDTDPHFPFRCEVLVRFNDCDPLGHANNALYSTYLEQARLGFLQDLRGFILARVEIDFRSPVVAGELLEIESRCRGVGSASFVLEHHLQCGERLVASAVSTIVSYDYERNCSTPVPAQVIARLKPKATEDR
jgi:acyl-CoA thioester hydrolase